MPGVMRHKMYSRLRLLFSVLLIASTNLFAGELDIPYVVKDACPFEGCTFGEWEVLEDTDVFASPNISSTLVSNLKKGSKVHVITGIEYITPGEARITGKPHSDSIDPSKPVLILNYLGEGYSQIFHNGKFIDTKIARTKTRCAENPNWRYCWVEVLQEPFSAWWVKVKDLGWVLMNSRSLKPIDALAYKAPHNKCLKWIGQSSLRSLCPTT